MKKSLFIMIAFSLICAILTILAVSWGISCDWPDNGHVDYGLPLVWATHTTSSIVGPVSIWIVDIHSLIIDLCLLLSIMLIGSSIMVYILTKNTKEKQFIAK